MKDPLEKKPDEPLVAKAEPPVVARLIVEIRPDRVIIAVVPNDPHTPINKMTVRPDGSATFST